MEEGPRAFAPSKALAASLSLSLAVFASANFFAVILNIVLPTHVFHFAFAFHDEVLMGLELMTAGTYVVFLGTAVLFLFWIHDANRSARAVGAEGLRYTPRAAVVWWFVPLASWIVPYRAMAELWKVSHARTVETWRSADTNAVMPCWWALWLGMVVMARITEANESSGSPSQSAPVVAALVNAAAALLAVWIVFCIQRGLTDKARRVSA